MESIAFAFALTGWLYLAAALTAALFLCDKITGGHCIAALNSIFH